MLTADGVRIAVFCTKVCNRLLVPLTAADQAQALTGDTFIRCCTYEDQAPILAIDDGNVSVSLTVPDVHRVTGEDVNRAMKLADAVAQYAAELGWYLRPPLFLPLAVRQRKR